MSVNCTETGRELSGKIFVACHVDESKKVYALSPEVIMAIQRSQRSNRKRTVVSGGINICKSRVAGSDGHERFCCEPSTDFCFSLEDRDFRILLPKTAAFFPKPPVPRLEPGLRPTVAAYNADNSSFRPSFAA